MKISPRAVVWFAFLAAALIADPRAALGGSPIYLRGVVEAHCSIVVSALRAVSVLPMTARASQRIQVGTILKSCNQKTGFTLTAASAVCATIPGGEKAAETLPQGALPYTVESDETGSGGEAASVKEFSAASCSTDIGSSVAVERGADGSSTLYVNFNMN